MSDNTRLVLVLAVIMSPFWVPMVVVGLIEIISEWRKK